MSEYISTNSGIHHQFRLYYKLGGNASQLWVSSCSTNIQWVASGKKSAFYLLPLLFLLSAPLKIASEGSKVRVWIERGLRMSVVSSNFGHLSVGSQHHPDPLKCCRRLKKKDRGCIWLLIRSGGGEALVEETFYFQPTPLTFYFPSPPLICDDL